MDKWERMKLESAVMNRLGFIVNIAELSDETLQGLVAPNPDLSVLDREIEPRPKPHDYRPLDEQLFGFKIWSR